MMSLPVKLGLATISFGVAGGLGYAGINYFGNDNKVENLIPERSIDELIKEEFKYILLKTEEGDRNEDQKHWETNWKKYKLANKSNTSGNDLFKLKDWTNQRDDIDLKEELKKECASLSTKKLKDRNSKLYSKVVDYCVRNVTITDEIGKLNLEALDTADGGKDETIWGQKVTGKANLQAHFSTLNIDFSSPDNKKIKTGCLAVKEKHKKEPNYETTLTAYQAVCTKQKGK